MATFGTLRDSVLSKAGVPDHFKFIMISPQHRRFWDDINRVEFDKGYSDAYLRPGSPALRDMELLTNEEYAEWEKRFDKINKQRR